MQSRVASMFGLHGAATRNRAKAMGGRNEVRAARTGGWFSATGSRIRGKGHSMLGALSGNRARQARGNALNDSGHVKQRWNRS
ncbi:hypothetical protein FRB99_008255 [Tulasnella sp. 403]|nr:hypothetical protein FRB99_008255 [Tulasnella sp. 403]